MLWSSLFREGLRGTNIVCEIDTLENLNNEFGQPKGYIFISDALTIRNADGPFQTRPTSYVRLTFVS